MPTSQEMGRTSSAFRPSIRLPSSRTLRRQLADAACQLDVLDLLRDDTLRLAHRGDQLLLCGDDTLDLAVRELDRGDDVVLAGFVRSTLDGHDGRLRTGDEELHVGFGDLLIRWRRDEVSADPRDGQAADRASERDVGEG